VGSVPIGSDQVQQSNNFIHRFRISKSSFRPSLEISDPGPLAKRRPAMARANLRARVELLPSFKGGLERRAEVEEGVQGSDRVCSVSAGVPESEK